MPILKQLYLICLSSYMIGHSTNWFEFLYLDLPSRLWGITSKAVWSLSINVNLGDSEVMLGYMLGRGGGYFTSSTNQHKLFLVSLLSYKLEEDLIRHLKMRWIMFYDRLKAKIHSFFGFQENRWQQSPTLCPTNPLTAEFMPAISHTRQITYRGRWSRDWMDVLTVPSVSEGPYTPQSLQFPRNWPSN